MKKLLLPSIIAMLAVVPAFAAPSLTCDASGIGATTPNARMKASWSPTVYNIEWYDDDGTLLNVQSSAQTCAYGNTLVLPSTTPTKVGYTFIGWEKEEIPDGFNYGSVCNEAVEETVRRSYAMGGSAQACLDLNDDGVCSNSNFGNLDEQASDYGITEPGQWGVRFSYGDVVGEAICSSTKGVENEVGTPDTNSDDGDNCWCRAMGYKLSGSNMCAVSSPVWVFHNIRNIGSGSGNLVIVDVNCKRVCAEQCASTIRRSDNSSFRATLFGSQQLFVIK